MDLSKNLKNNDISSLSCHEDEISQIRNKAENPDHPADQENHGCDRMTAERRTYVN